MRAAHAVLGRALSTPGACLHWYGKSECRKGRKLGHINIVGRTRSEVRHRLNQVAKGASDVLTRTGEATRDAGLFRPSHAEVAIIMGSDSDLSTMSAAAQVRGQASRRCIMPHCEFLDRLAIQTCRPSVELWLRRDNRFREPYAYLHTQTTVFRRAPSSHHLTIVITGHHFFFNMFAIIRFD